MLNYAITNLRKALEVICGYVFGLLILQWVINRGLSWYISSRSETIRQVSFYYFLGTTSLRALNICTSKFELRIGKIGLNISTKPCLVIENLEVRLSPKDSNAKGTAQGGRLSPDTSTSNPDILNTAELSLNLSNWLIRVLRFIHKIPIYAHNSVLVLPGGTAISNRMATVTFVKRHSNTIIAELFLHETRNMQTRDTFNHICYRVSAQVKLSETASHSHSKINICTWNAHLRLSDARIQSAWDPLNEKRAGVNIEHDNASETQSDVINCLENFTKRYESYIRKLKVLDLKFENLHLLFADRLKITLSSSLIYLESVPFYDTGSVLDMVPIKYNNWGNFELSLTSSALAVSIGKTSVLRVPTLNILVNSNVVLFLLNRQALQDTRFSCVVNIVNPSATTTFESAASAFNRREAQSFSTSQQSSFSLVEYIVSDNLPSINFELQMSNLSLKLMISDEQNIIVSVYNVQMLLSKVAQQNNAYIEQLKSILQLHCRVNDYATSDIDYTNFLKIVDFRVAFLDHVDEKSPNPSLLPILGFERWDTFLEDVSTKRLNFNSTLRHAYISLDDITILEVLSDLIDDVKSNLTRPSKDSQQNDMNAKTKSGHQSKVDWNIKFRIKHISFSSVIASFLPRHLDPVENDHVNLTDIPRGLRLVLKDTVLQYSPFISHLKVAQCKGYNIGDSFGETPSSQSVFQLSDFSFTSRPNKASKIEIPSITLNIDLNIIWVIFLKIKVWQYYFQHSSFKKEYTGQAYRVIDVLKTLDIKITRILCSVMLPHMTEVIFRLDCSGSDENNDSVEVNKITAFVESEYVKDVRVNVPLMEIKDLSIDPRKSIAEDLITLNIETLRFSSEYHFRFYTVVDNFITFYKSIKQIKTSFSDIQDFKRHYPTEEKPAKFKNIRLLANKFLIDVHEDPFEQDLGLIFKMGVFEQRNRLQKWREYDNQISKFRKLPLHARKACIQIFEENNPSLGSLTENSYENNIRLKLYENFSASWIARYRKARLALDVMPSKLKQVSSFDRDLYFYSNQQLKTVGNLTINQLDLQIMKPSFPINEFMYFIHDYGKGVSLNTTYTLLVVLGLKVKTNLWELRLRDYPIPAISLPDTSTSGDFVIAEQMPAKESLHEIFIPFVKPASSVKYSERNTIYGTRIIRTLNSIKFYMNLKTYVRSSIPAHITWGKSLQPAYESMMLWFDLLTKPPIDPSPKMGFWDKFRFLIHGKWIYEFSEKTSFHLNIKGSTDPYKIADDGAGLSFCWTGGTRLSVHGTNDPREFLEINSKRFLLAVPDFTKIDKFEKVFMKLDGEVKWSMGMLFEMGDFNSPGSTLRETPRRPHYDVVLVNPISINNVQNHDSYQGFRSSFIHLSFGVFSTKVKSTNNIYLASYSITHFLKWWNLFHTFTSGPIRQGPIFTDLVQNPCKFGRSLFTIKYQLHLEPLRITHVFKHLTKQYDIEDVDKTYFTGLIGNADSIKIDLHQSRIKLTHANAKLNKSNSIWKFRMTKGEIDCSSVDIRILHSIFAIPNASSSSDIEGSRSVELSTTPYSNLFDPEDYMDLDYLNGNLGKPKVLEAVPLLFSPKISYFRNLADTGYPVVYPFGEEDTHFCQIGHNHPELTQKKLVSQRKNTVERQILEVEDLIKFLSLDNKSHKTTPKSQEMKKLEARLHNLKHSLHTIHNLYDDLKLAEEASNLYFDPEEAESSVDEELQRYTTSISRVKSSALESFVSMRRASNVDAESSYNNRFIIHNLQLKVDKKIRHHLYEYMTSISQRKAMAYFVTHKSIKILEELLSSGMNSSQTEPKSHDELDEADYIGTTKFLEEFDEIMRDIPDEKYDTLDSYLFRFISPQAQFTSGREPDSAIILSARDIEVGIVDLYQVYGKAGVKIPIDIGTNVETRVGTVAKDLQIFTFFKEDLYGYDMMGFHLNEAMKSNGQPVWPPWLPIELCYDGTLLDKYVFVKRRNMHCIFTIPNPLFVNDKDVLNVSNNSRFLLGFSDLAITCTSKQYSVVYAIAEDLFTFSVSIDEKIEKLSKVLLADEVRNNLDDMDVKLVVALQLKVKELYYTRAYLKLHDAELFNTNLEDISFELQTALLQLTILMSAIKQNYDRVEVGEKSGSLRFLWQLGTEELVIEMFDENKQPFLLASLKNPEFVGAQESNGTSSNMIKISDIRLFNQQQNPVYQQLLSPYHENSLYNMMEPMVSLFWKCGHPVGGIPDLREVIIALQPFVFKMDHLTSHKIIEYLFPSDEIKGSKSNIIVHNDGSSRASNHSLDFSSYAMFKESQTNPNGKKVYRTAQTSSDISNFVFDPSTVNIREMVQRSGTYFNVGTITIKEARMSISYKGSKSILTDVNNLLVSVHPLIYKNKLWSRTEFFDALKNDITNVVLHHLGRIIGNKLVPHKKENKQKIKKSISKILHKNSLKAGDEDFALPNPKAKDNTNKAADNKKPVTDPDIQPYQPFAEYEG